MIIKMRFNKSGNIR